VYEIDLIVCESLCLDTKKETRHLQLGHLPDGYQLELGKFHFEKKLVAYGLCEACLIGKDKRSVSKRLYATRMLKSCVAGDICGPFKKAVFNGEQYMLVLMDCKSKYEIISWLVTRRVQLIVKNVKDLIKPIKTASGGASGEIFIGQC
jgi:hypothetical protein